MVFNKIKKKRLKLQFSKSKDKLETDKWNVVQDSLDEVVEDDEDKSIHLKGIVVEIELYSR